MGKLSFHGSLEFAQGFIASFLKFWSITIVLHGMSDLINVIFEHLIKKVIH